MFRVLAQAPAGRQSDRRGNNNCPPLSFEQYRKLPYGAYICADGSIFLYDRKYRPIFNRGADGRVSHDDPARCVHGIRSRVWFYTDAASPRVNREILQRLLSVQRRWEGAAAGLQMGLDQLLPVEWIVNAKHATGLAA